MENQLKKWVGVSYITLTGLVIYIVQALVNRLVVAYDLEAQMSHIDMFVTGGSFAIGLGLLIFLWKSAKVNQFTTEVATELYRVTWPTGTETQKATVVVLIMVVISGFFLGLLDMLWTWLLKQVL